MARPENWRVRVKSAIETWVEVPAYSAVGAEVEAAKVPGVISVFGKSAIRANLASEPEPMAGVRED